MSKKVAVWGKDYDLHDDQCYKRPVCPDCKAPFGRSTDGKYYCYECGEEVTISDKDMLEWLKEYEERKVEMHDCTNIFGCGGKGCMEVHYRKSPITKEWRTAWGVCTKCGAKFIV